MPGKSFSRAVRKVHILQVFYKRFEDNELSEMTSSQVARALGLEPSFHIRGLLAELVISGNLTVREVYDNRGQNLNVGRAQGAPKNDGKMYLFRLSETERQNLEEKMREIPVKVKGKQVLQMRLL